jgi:hypothetical protein
MRSSVCSAELYACMPANISSNHSYLPVPKKSKAGSDDYSSFLTLLQYEAFWRDPHQAPVLWIAQLFCMLCMSAQLSEAIGSEPPSPPEYRSPRASFLAAAAQCLVLGHYAKPQRYVVEALCLYAQCKYMDTLDPAGEVYALFGIIIRQAFRMGYHRDPKHFPNMSVFEGEMRRRSWAMIRHFDLMNSFQVGLPSNIQSGQYDVALPRNLLDSDFDELSIVLPVSRPETDVDQITYFIAKGRLMTVFEKILNEELSMEAVSHNRIMQLDSELRQAHSTVPLPLKHKPMAQSFADPAHVIMVRLNIELLYQKSVCVLHRKYLVQKTSNSYSRNACATAAMKILNHQASVHQESQPGGQLYQDRWMLSSFTFNDFFLAAMILCLDVSTNHSTESGNDPDDMRKTKIDMLNRSYLICAEQRSNSKEARRVTDALAAMLVKLGASVSTPPLATDLQSTGSTFPTPPFSTSSIETASDQMSGLNMAMDPLENFMSMPENIDWVSHCCRGSKSRQIALTTCRPSSTSTCLILVRQVMSIRAGRTLPFWDIWVVNPVFDHVYRCMAETVWNSYSRWIEIGHNIGARLDI